MKTVTLAAIACAIALAGCGTTTVSSDSNCARFEDRIEKIDGQSAAVNRCVAWQFGPSLGQRARFAQEQQRLSNPAPAGAQK